MPIASNQNPLQGGHDYDIRDSKKRKIATNVPKTSESNSSTEYASPMMTGFYFYHETPTHPLNTSSAEQIDLTFPKRNVALSDYDMGRIIQSGLPACERGARYPDDFDRNGLPLKSRVGKGLPAYLVNEHGLLFYMIVCGTTQLHGEEGTKRGWRAQVNGLRMIAHKPRPGSIVVDEDYGVIKKIKQVVKAEEDEDHEAVKKNKKVKRVEEDEHHEVVKKIKKAGMDPLYCDDIVTLAPEEDEPTDGATDPLLKHTQDLNTLLIESMTLAKDLLTLLAKPNASIERSALDVHKRVFTETSEGLYRSRLALDAETLSKVRNMKAK